MAPEISQIVIAAPIVTQKSWRRWRIAFAVCSMTLKAAGETFGRIWGAIWSCQTPSRCRNPSAPRAKRVSGTRAKKTWNEIALA
jgi:hypothetical protein